MSGADWGEAGTEHDAAAAAGAGGENVTNLAGEADDFAPLSDAGVEPLATPSGTLDSNPRAYSIH